MRMKKRKEKNCLIAWLLFITMILGINLLLPADKKDSKHADIIETVTVKNIELPVRVFQGKTSIEGLTKKDFKLFVNGKERPINGFYSMSKKLDLNPGPESVQTKKESVNKSESRLFTLIFNITAYHQDLKPMLHYFFQKVIKPGDRLMFISNNFFFPEWKIASPEKTEKSIIAILNKEVKRMHTDIASIENELKAQAAILKAEIADALAAEATGIDMTEAIGISVKTFYITYNIILDDIKSRYLQLPMASYIKVADYIRAQPGKKWVLNFFQLGRVPRLETYQKIDKRLHLFSEKEAVKTGADMQVAGKLNRALMNDISKAFINCGATFHTMILRPSNAKASDDYKFIPVASEAELILKKMARLTGGTVTDSNDMAAFAKKISQKQDTVYMLTYVPDPVKKKPGKVKVIVTNKNSRKKYNVVFDNQKRVKAFRNMKNKLHKMTPGLEIEKIAYKGSHLMVKLNNIKIVNYDGKSFGAVKARIKIKRNRGGIISDMEKSFKSVAKDGIIKTRLPQLVRGRFNIILEIKDLFSLDNRYVGDAITITKQ